MTDRKPVRARVGQYFHGNNLASAWVEWEEFSGPRIEARAVRFSDLTKHRAALRAAAEAWATAMGYRVEWEGEG